MPRERLNLNGVKIIKRINRNNEIYIMELGLQSK